MPQTSLMRCRSGVCEGDAARVDCRRCPWCHRTGDAWVPRRRRRRWGGVSAASLLGDCHIAARVRGGGFLWSFGGEQLADTSKLCLAMAIGKEAVVPDSLEAIGQDVQEKTADKFVRGQCHARNARFMPVVLPGEGDLIVRSVDEAVIGDGYAVGVAAEASAPKTCSGPAKGLLVSTTQLRRRRGSKECGECTGFSQMHDRRKNASASRGEQRGASCGTSLERHIETVGEEDIQVGKQSISFRRGRCRRLERCSGCGDGA